MRTVITLVVEMTDAQRDAYENEYGDVPTPRLIRERVVYDVQGTTLGEFATVREGR